MLNAVIVDTQDSAYASRYMLHRPLQSALVVAVAVVVELVDVFVSIMLQLVVAVVHPEREIESLKT